MIPNCPSLLCSYLFTRSLLLPLVFPFCYLAVGHNILVNPVLSGEFSSHFCNCYRLKYLEVTRGLGENGWNFQRNEGVIRPIRIFLPLHLANSGNLVVAIVSHHLATPLNCMPSVSWTLFIMVHAMDLLLPPSSPLIFPIIGWTGSLPVPDVGCSIYPLALYTPPYPLPVPMIISLCLSTGLYTAIFLLYISGLLLPPPQIAQIAQIRHVPPHIGWSANKVSERHVYVHCEWRTSWVNNLRSSMWALPYATPPANKASSTGHFPRCSRALTTYISKKIFRLGGIAPSEWTRSVWAVRDTPVAEYSVPGVNTMGRVVYRPPIAVSLSLRVLSVSYFKRSLWRCGQLWQYVGMDSLGMRLHRDWNAMGDAANISPRVPSTSAQNAILITNYTHHSKSPDLCGYWQSIARSVRLLSN